MIVAAKYAGEKGYGTITLRPPGDNYGNRYDPGRPFWVDRTTNGAPLTIDVTPSEWEEVHIGDLFVLTLARL